MCVSNKIFAPAARVPICGAGKWNIDSLRSPPAMQIGTLSARAKFSYLNNPQLFIFVFFTKLLYTLKYEQ